MWLNILISAVVSVAGAWGVYNYAPLSLFEGWHEPTFGSTITTINGTDTLSSSRAVINTNFSNLNTDKLESGSTAATLTVTTLTLGNDLTAANGGTGSSTLSLNQVMLGNGTSGFKTPSGWGTSGQALLSNGSGSAPSWGDVTPSLSASYVWTGYHNFSYGLNAALASSTNATTTNLTVTGNTVGIPKKIGLTTSSVTVANSQATTTLFSYIIPGGSLSTNNFVRAKIYIRGTSMDLEGTFCTPLYLVAGYGTGSTTMIIDNGSPLKWIVGSGSIDVLLAGTGATNSQKLTMLWNTTATSSASKVTDDAGNKLGTTTLNQMESRSIAIDSTVNQHFGFQLKMAGTADPACWFISELVTSELIR